MSKTKMFLSGTSTLTFRIHKAKEVTWSGSKHSGELIALPLVNLSPSLSLSGTTTESRDAGDKFSSILRTAG